MPSHIFRATCLPGAPDSTPPLMSSKPKHTFEIYRSHGQFRWRVTAANGRKVANSGEAYRNRADLARAATNLFSDSTEMILQIANRVAKGVQAK